MTCAAKKIFFLLLISSFLLTLNGCAAAGVMAYKLSGPPKVDPKYVPAQTPLLVLAENRTQPSATVGPEVLTSYVIDELTTNKVAPIVPAEELQALRDSKLSAFKSMSVSAIGQAVGAEQILYIEFGRDSVLPLQGGEAFQGQVEVHVKIIDAADGRTLWPTDLTTGYPLSASSTLGQKSSQGTIEDVRRRMYLTLSDEIAKLFYKWQPENLMPGE